MRSPSATTTAASSTTGGSLLVTRCERAHATRRRYLREKLPYAVELYYPPGSDLVRLRLRASAWPELQKNRAEDEPRAGAPDAEPE